MIPPNAAIPADLAATSLGALFGPTAALAVLVSLVTLVVLLAGLVAEHRDAVARALLTRGSRSRLAPTPARSVA